MRTITTAAAASSPLLREGLELVKVGEGETLARFARRAQLRLVQQLHLFLVAELEDDLADLLVVPRVALQPLPVNDTQSVHLADLQLELERRVDLVVEVTLEDETEAKDKQK